MARRGAAGWALGVVAVAAAFAVGRSCAPVETVFVERPAAPSRGPLDPREPRGPARRETPRAADVVAEATAAGDAVLAAEPAPGAADVDAFPAVDVEVVRADGTPEPKVCVYALAAGAPGVGESDFDKVPHVECDDAGRCRLRLPRAGRYDVATWPALGEAIAIDVDAPGDHVVRLTLPEMSPLTFHVADDARPRPGERPVDFNVNVGTLSSDDEVRFPGRGQRLSWSLSTSVATLPAGRTTFVLGWPRGLPGSVGTSRPLTARPRTFSAPADIEIARVTSDFCVRYGAAFAEPERTWPRYVPVRIDVRWNDEGSTSWSETVEPGETLQGAFDSKWSHWLERRSGVVRWSGPGLLPGELAFANLATDGTATLLLPVRLDPNADLPPSDRLTTKRRVRVSAPPGLAADAEVKVRLFDSLGTVVHSADVRPGATWESDSVSARWVLAASGACVSRPAVAPEPSDGVVDVALEPGGFLVVVPDGPTPPDALGRVWLERVDGLPFVWVRTIERDDDVPPDVRAGLVLGPLAPGAVSFRIRSTGGDLGEARAVVRVGKYDVLRLPRLASR